MKFQMSKNSKIFVAGHTGLVGSSILRGLNEKGYENIITRTHKELDLTRQKETEEFFMAERLDCVFLAAAVVGGIMANKKYPAKFIYVNLVIASNVINSAYESGVKKLINLGSSCIYPKVTDQPIKEDQFLNGKLEESNEPYAIAKIAAIKLCTTYNKSYSTDFISVMPCNLYGPNDNFDIDDSHLLAALIRKFDLGKLLIGGKFQYIQENIIKWDKEEDAANWNKTQIEKYLNKKGIFKNSVVLWGTGNPLREFLYVDDLSNGCIFLMENYSFDRLGDFINVGSGKEIAVKDLAILIADLIGYKGKISFNRKKIDGTSSKTLDISRIKSFGWEPKVSFKEGLEKICNYYINSDYRSRKSH